MTSTDPVEFEFQQLTTRDNSGREIYGMELSGTAYLESNNPPGYGYRDEFYVESIVILGGLVLTRKRAEASKTGFEGVLFKQIADQIENSATEIGKDAQAVFSDAVAEQMEAA